MGVKRINLLPREERQKASRERGLTYALLFLVLVIAVLGVLYVFERQRVSSRQDQLGTVQSELSGLQARVSALQPYGQLQSQRASMSDTAKQVLDSRIVWSSISEEISLLIPDRVRLTQLTAVVPAPMLAGSALSGGGAGAAAVADIAMVGVADDFTDVADFMTRLGLMPQLTNIQLASTQKSTQEGTVTVTFTINASLRPFQVAPPLAVPRVPSVAGGGSQ
jgi:Tfp pilus assembly protein PilN